MVEETTLTKKDREALLDYTRWIADEIGLRDWAFEFPGGEPDNENWGADVECLPGRKVANIRFRGDCREWDLDTLRATICHELVHCHLAPLQHQCENDLDGLLGRPSAEVFFNGFRRNLEYAVDAVAEAIAPHMPLIEWPA